MKRLNYIAFVAFISGCTSTANMQWVNIGPGPTLEYAQAQCNILSMGTQQSMVAWGSPGYVAGAQLGNAIGNAIAADQFIKNCMVMQGWKKMPTGQSATASTVSPQRTSQYAATNRYITANRKCGAGDKAACKAGRALLAEAKRLGAKGL